MTRKQTVFYTILSPLLLIGICAAIQVSAGQLLGVWAWVPTMFMFWAVISALLRRFSRHTAVSSRFGPGSGHFIWSVLAVAAGLLSLHGFLDHWSLLADWYLILAWAAFALVNPWFEESYWRGLLMDSTASWGKVPSLLYTSALFTVSHPLIWGIHSLPLRKVEALVGLFVVGLIWGLAYQRTRTLRWCVVGHMLANLFGLAALVLLNLYDPTVRHP